MIWKLAGTAAVGILSYALLKTCKPEYAALSQALTAAALLFLISGELKNVTAFFAESLGYTGMDFSFSGVLLRVLGVALITQFCADTARDNGQQGLAQAVEFAGKVLIAALALPVMKAVLQMITEFSENL